MKYFIYLLSILLLTFTNVHAQLPPRPNTIILLSMPADEAEFKNIFQRNPTQDEMKNITTLLNENKNLKNVYLLKKEDDVDKVMEVLPKVVEKLRAMSAIGPDKEIKKDVFTKGH